MINASHIMKWLTMQTLKVIAFSLAAAIVSKGTVGGWESGEEIHTGGPKFVETMPANLQWSAHQRGQQTHTLTILRWEVQMVSGYVPQKLGCRLTLSSQLLQWLPDHEEAMLSDGDEGAVLQLSRSRNSKFDLTVTPLTPCRCSFALRHVNFT